MKRLINFMTLAIFITILVPAASMAQRRAVVRRPVVVRRPIVRRTLVLHPGHPLRRRLRENVVVRTARHNVLINRPLVFLPALTWTRTVVPLPARDRLVWQDSETISRDEEWVDTNFGIDQSGSALFLDINGRAKLNFAEITFANGNVQVVDFNEQTHDRGVYKLMDFADGRHVSTMRILAKSESDETKLSVYLSK
jgi:hypothetical protein